MDNVFLATYVCVNLPRALTYQDRVATIKLIATGHAGTTQAMQDHRPSKINFTCVVHREEAAHSVADHTSCMQGMK